MGLLPRLKAKLGSLFAPAADPRAETASVYQRHVELLGRLEAALAAISTSKRQLQVQTERMKGRLPQLEAQAREALVAGKEDAARLTLRRRREAAVELQRLEAQVTDVAQEEERLALARQRLAAQIEGFRTRQEVVSARYTAAEAQVRINEALAGLSQDLSGLGTALEQAEAKTEHMQARASAIDELMQSGSLRHGPGGAVEAETTDPGEALALEQELEALKKEIAHGEEGKGPPSGHRSRPEG